MDVGKLFGFLGLICVVSANLRAEPSPSVTVKVSLFPVGSFTIQSSALTGKGLKKGDHYSASELKVATQSLATGIDLRDQHLKKKLKQDQFPHIKATDIKASAGKGTAQFTVMEMTKEVAFTFQDLGKNLAKAEFNLKLSDFKIEGISYEGIGVEDDVQISVVVPYAAE